MPNLRVNDAPWDFKYLTAAHAPDILFLRHFLFCYIYGTTNFRIVGVWCVGVFVFGWICYNLKLNYFIITSIHHFIIITVSECFARTRSLATSILHMYGLGSRVKTAGK